ncbi:MAG: 5'-3' exonuclease H3TH domain-containing protein, partial [Alphaproteobacteria bacterium]
MSKVCLIDGSGYIFRAFYALPTMNAPDGTPVNAVYGFMTMFMRLLKTIPCDYCVVLFDAKRENFRNQYFADYKATRAEVPELLIPQFDLIHQAVEVMGLPYVLQEGYEADDLIATYAKAAVDAGNEAVVVSADKDLMQLIRSGVTYYDGMKDKFFTPEDVKEKCGVYPDRVVDVQALAGDSTDNIPGVPGIGLKTAAELVNEFGSLQGVLENAEKIKQNKRRELITNNREAAEISLKLVTLKDDVPVEHQLEEFKCRAPNGENLLAFVDKLGFKSIRPKLEKWAEERCCALGEQVTPVENASQVAPSYTLVNDRAILEKLYKEIKNVHLAAIQVLYDGVNVVGFSFSTGENTAYYLPLSQANVSGDLFSFEPNKGLERDTVLKFLRSVLEDTDILKIAAGLKDQWHKINQLFETPVNLFPYDDVSVMSYDLDSSEHEHTLSALARWFLDYPLAEPKVSGKIKQIDFLAEEYNAYVYSAADCLMRLYN